MLVFMSILVPLAVGGLLTYLGPKYLRLSNYNGDPQEVTLKEFSVVAPVIVIVAVMVTLVWGPKVAKAQAANGYQQFLNGSIVSANVDKISCGYEDGPCVHTFSCHAYTVTVVDQSAYTDSKGNYHAEVSHQETRYHQCPYGNYELTYYLKDSLGRTINVPPTNIYDNGTRPGPDSSGLPRSVSRDVPTRWTTSKTRLESGDAEPVTKVGSYTNYILATEAQALKSYSSQIGQYQKLGLMPDHTAKLKSGPTYDLGTKADKLSFVGIKLDNATAWQDSLMRFNAALGMERRGDLHVVIVPASKISDPDGYANAVKTFWQNRLGKWGFPKNGIMLVLGASDDNTTVQWARANTGMPTGNGEMISALMFDLNGAKLDPDVILGHITASVKTEGGKAKPVYTHGNGIVDNIMFTKAPFQRACMNCKDKGDTGTSFVYLKDEIPVSTGAKVLMFFIVFALSSVLWAAALFTNLLPSSRPTPKRQPEYLKHYKYNY